MSKKALISVSDKTNVIEIAKDLQLLGYEIISTGGTQKILEDNGIKTSNISEITNFPEMMDGRVKTLHPNVHGALLAKRNNPNHMKQIAEQNIMPIDVVIVNLYPFQQTINKPNFTFEEAIENIDIGGPSMLRSAAKNFEDVLVLTDPSDYEKAIEFLKDKNTHPNLRKQLAAKVFRLTAFYDSLIANYLTKEVEEKFPERTTFGFEKKQDLRYGENPHQDASFYRTPFNILNSLVECKQLQGKELSYNNIQDANAAIRIVSEFKEHVVVALKHMNPCGVGTGQTIFEAWTNCLDGDPVSIFGGIIATNQEIDKKTAEGMSKIFLEIVIAPGFTNEALEIFAKKKNLRVLKSHDEFKNISEMNIVSINGGVLLQEVDDKNIDDCEIKIVTTRKPTTQESQDIIIAQKIVKHVKSNAIVIVKNKQLIGVGAGQMNRIGAAKIALEWCKKKCEGAVMGSDAFFPFSDVVTLANEYGITAVVQPGGSMRDQDSIDEANKHNMSMAFTNMRHFKH